MTFFYDLNKKLAGIADKPETKQLNEGAVAEASTGDYSAKKARAGKDIGKPGKAFGKIAADAGKRYGSKAAGERGAGAVLNKLRHPNESADVPPHREKGVAPSQIPAALRKAQGRAPLSMQDLEREEQRKLTNPETMKRLRKELSNEELVGGQKKLDRNHNGELDAQDFAILRKGKKKDVEEGWDEMMKDVEARSKKPKVGEKERGHKHDIEHTATGRKVTRRVDDQGHSVGADDEEDHSDQPKRRGRPKGSKHSTGAKINSGKSKLMTKEAEHDGDEVKQAMAVLKKAGYKITKAKEEELDEKAVSKAQQRFMGMVHATQKGEKAPSKEVAKVAKSMKKKDAEDFAATKHKGLPEKKTEESAEEPKSKSKGGFSFGKGIYDSYNREVEAIIAESMNISMNMSNDSHGGPGKSLTVTATDDDAMKLASLLKMAGLGGGAGAESTAEPCSDCGMEDCGCEHELDEVDENQPDYPTNTEEGDALQYSGGLNGPKSTGQTTTPVIASQLNRQVTHEDDAMGRTALDVTMGEAEELDEGKECDTCHATPCKCDESIEESLSRIRNLAGIQEAAKDKKPDDDNDGIPNWADKNPKKAGGDEDRKVEESILSMTNLWKAYKG